MASLNKIYANEGEHIVCEGGHAIAVFKETVCFDDTFNPGVLLFRPTQNLLKSAMTPEVLNALFVKHPTSMLRGSSISKTAIDE